MAEVGVIAGDPPTHLEPTYRYSSMDNNEQWLLLPPTPGYGMHQPLALPSQLPQPRGCPSQRLRQPFVEGACRFSCSRGESASP
ncbi:hypothetical protein MRX96_003077 [Rhipicephalus microplus]